MLVNYKLRKAAQSNPLSPFKFNKGLNRWGLWLEAQAAQLTASGPEWHMINKKEIMQ